MHGCVQKFVDGILDLIAPRPAGAPLISRGPGVGEFIYLGPDENITPADINRMEKHAASRRCGRRSRRDRAGPRAEPSLRLLRYAMPSAFISSKPQAGINHKEYGVTSEGVAVMLQESRELGASLP